MSDVELWRTSKSFFGPAKIYSSITAKTWPYKTQMEFYHARDRALMSLLYLTCGRVTEVLSVRKSQFVMDEDPDFVIITNACMQEAEATTQHKNKLQPQKQQHA